MVFMWRKHLIGICLFLLTLFGCITFFPYQPLTPDEKLMENFFHHRAEFEEIVQMMNEDSNVRTVYKEHVSLEGNPVWRHDTQPGFSTERWNEYKRLFSQLGPLVHRISKEGDIVVVASASVAVSEIDEYESVVKSKGYAYSLKEPSPLVESLDNPQLSNTCYKKLDTNWYLYYDEGISKPE